MSTDDDIILPDAFQSEDAREVFCESDDAESDSDYKSLYTTFDVDSDGEADIDTPVNNDTGHRAPLALDQLEGVYRLLDLITEQGSGGTFDKVIIDQASLEAFINDISPGAYKSLTKVDFKKLDQWNIKPVGVYGSSEEIMRFLVSLGAVPPERVDNLKSIRSGLYLVKPQDDLASTISSIGPNPRLGVTMRCALGFNTYCDAITKTKTTQALYTLDYKPASVITKTFEETLTSLRLRHMLQRPGVSFSMDVNDDTIEVAIENGFGTLHAHEIGT